MKKDIKELLNRGIPHLLFLITVGSGTWMLVATNNTNFEGVRNPADVSSSATPAVAASAADSATVRLDKIKAQIAANRAKLAGNQKDLQLRTQTAGQDIKSRGSVVRDQVSDRLSALQQQIRDRRNQLNGRVTASQDDPAVTRARAQLQSARTWAEQARADGISRLQNARANAQGQLNGQIADQRGQLQDRLEQLKEDIRAKHGDLTVRNIRLTMYRSENMLFVNLGEGFDQVSINLDNYNIQTGKNLLDNLSPAAEVSVMGFREFVDNLTSAIYAKSKEDIKPELATATDERAQLDQAVDQITSIRARTIVDRIATAAKEATANANVIGDRVIDSSHSQVSRELDHINATVTH